MSDKFRVTPGAVAGYCFVRAVTIAAQLAVRLHVYNKICKALNLRDMHGAPVRYDYE